MTNPVPPLASAVRMPALRLSDLRGLTRLGFDAVGGVTGLVESMHGTIAAVLPPLGQPPADRARGLSGLVYRAVRGTAAGVGAAVDLAWRGAEAWWPLTGEPGTAAPSPAREAMLAALNGVCGDRLAADGNPLAINMAFRVDGHPLTLTTAGLAQALPQATGRVLVLLHGLCMNDLQWRRDARSGGVGDDDTAGPVPSRDLGPVAGQDLGRALAASCGFTPVWLHCNSGRHVADNGADLARLLDDLLANWPEPVTELVLLGHSMGGLVARSAIAAADAQGLAWRRHLRSLVCLGTPHHGAALERSGRALDTLLALSPYVAPFARIGQLRSAGITDLRFGNVRPEDQPPEGRHAHGRDVRQPTPLPQGVQTYCVAATTAAQPRGLKHALLGDGLVSVASAFGEHARPDMALTVPPAHRLLVTKANHWDLLGRPEVTAQLQRWLTPA